MRVLRVSHSAVVGEWRAREQRLRARGTDVRLLSARSWDEGGRTVELEPLPGEDVAGVATLGRHPALFVYDPRPLWRALGERWDVLDVHEEPFALATAEILLLRALRRQRAPYVLYSAQNLPKRYPWPFRSFERRALAGAAGVSTCNTGAARIVRRKGLRGPAPTIPLGVDLERFSPAPEPRGTGERVRVGYVGRLEPHKGLDVLLDAVADDERLTLRVVGGGSSRDHVAARAARIGARVVLAGGVPHEDLPALYRSFDVLAVPSLTTPGWVEQFGRVAVEAMACGVPVVASDSGALPDVVGGAGVLVPEGDAAALRDALLRVGTDPVEHARLRAAGLRRAAECSWDRVAQQQEELYRSATRRTRADDAPARGRDLRIVVVAYGRPELLDAALAPLAGRWPITVVDNSSSPAVRDVATAHGARYVDPGANLGFAAGVNRALGPAPDPGTDVLLLNPDAVVAAGDVEALRHALDADPSLATVGPVQVDDDGVAARVTWPFPSPGGAWLEASGLGSWRRGPEFVIGSVLLVRGAALRDVGPFDTRFFLYAEESDWAFRAVRAGWRHAAVPAARATHAAGATSTDPRRRDAHFHAGVEKFLRKHYGTLGWQVARAGVLAGAVARALLPTPARGEASRRARLYLVGPARAERAYLPGARA